MTREAPVPSHIAVIGGGRWARVLTKALCGLVPPSTRITVHSARNAAGMKEWADSSVGLAQVEVFPDWPVFTAPCNAAGIVVNAARDHVESAARLIEHGVSTLVEKPVSTDLGGLQALMKVAEAKAVRLASAHIFAFAKYLDNFAEAVRSSGRVLDVEILWEDASREIRHGGEKSYDPGLPVFTDVLPHLVSLLSPLTAGEPALDGNIEMADGGAYVRFGLEWSGALCRIALKRNGERRQRILRVQTEREVLTLDFSEEPGTIRVGALEKLAHPGWSERDRPSAQMLTAFLGWASGGPADSRLGLENALTACRLSDELMTPYRAKQIECTMAALLSGRADDPDVRYALTELLQSAGPLPVAALEAQIEFLGKAFRSTRGPARAHEIGRAPSSEVALLEFATRNHIEDQ
ncbi:MAG: Gfo/Idh/MocA family oxidoreductase [Gemmatimonadaceae bacterium]|nr:Gfo/Idh/MocA family oxidoreductase [Gemmatimonadaceae bacterium]